jgi:hypothetical protein
MRLIHIRTWLAVAIGAGLLAGCSHTDNTVKNDTPVTPIATAQSSALFSPQSDRSKIPPQFAQQFPGSSPHGTNKPKM